MSEFRSHFLELGASGTGWVPTYFKREVKKMRTIAIISFVIVVVSMILQSLGEGFLSFILLATGGMVFSACAVAYVAEYFESEI